MTSSSSSGLSATSLLIGCFFLLGFIGVLLLSTMILGNVHGEEFSPQTFSCREFSYHRFPITRSRLTSTHLPAPTGALACSPDISIHLKTGVGANGPVRWDLADHTIGSDGPIHSDASILLTYLRSNHWNQWTLDHPPLAALLWPAVQQLAIQECYFAIPELMQGAEEATSPAGMSAAIDRISLQSAEVSAKKMEASNKTEAAFQLAAWGLQHGKSSYLESLLNSKPTQDSKPTEDPGPTVEAEISK